MPRADNNAATVSPPIPPPTTTTSYMNKDLLNYVFIHEAAQHDQHRLNSIEDEMDDE